MGYRWWLGEEPEEKHIEGWWTIGEAPNYEINDEGVVRHKETGRIIPQYGNGKGTDYRMVSLRAYGKSINRSVKALIETGRKYQGH
jgi:hypothetical protein